MSGNDTPDGVTDVSLRSVCAFCGEQFVPARRGAKFCRGAHRQADWRRRHRDQGPDERELARRAELARDGMLHTAKGVAVAAAVFCDALERGWVPGLDADSPPATSTFTVAPFTQHIKDLVTYAVLADRADGATWQEIGGALGLSADAVRRRYARITLRDRTGQSPDIHATHRGH